MYLHRLDLRAIGPYPDLVSIDFAALAASGVFLLEGPTGAGKSTIIDAVVFALYGGLAGSDASTDRLHSQHADPSVEPFVELVFETGAGVHRVRRTPQYDRPKQRGTGTVKQQASAQLFRLAGPADPAGEPVSSRIPEVGAEIARIVGLDRAQFLQTVVLPQGEFARFLRSPGEDRRKLLQSLFGTQVYDRTADELAARRRAVQAEVEGADARVRDTLSRFAQAAGLVDADEPSVPGTVARLRVAADAASTRRAATAAIAQASTAREHRVAARAAAFARRTALLARRAALEADAVRIAAARERLVLAERAARVVLVADGLQTARRRAADATARCGQLRAQHGVEVHDDELDGIRRATTETLAAVRHLVAVEDGFPARRAALTDAAARVQRLTEQLAETDAALDARPAERARIVEDARNAAAAAAGGEAARLEVARVERLRADLVARTEADRRVLAAERTVADARAAAQARLRVEQDLRERRIAGLAGELGAALVPGDACPVCGATEHPVIARPQDDHPTTAAIEAAATASRDAEQALSRAASDLAVQRADAARLAQVVGDTDPDTVDALDADARSAVAAAQEASRLVADLERQRSAHDERTRTLERERHDVDAERSVLVATSASDTERLEQDERTLREALERMTGHLGSTPGSVRDGVRALEQVSERLEAVARADELAAGAARAVSDRADELDRVLAEQQIADEAAARDAVLATAESERLRSEVDAADRERAVVDAGLAEPAVVAAAHDEPARLDPDAAGRARAHAVAVAEDVARRAVSADDRATAAERCAAEVRAAVRDRDDTSSRSRAVVRLADVAAGVTTVNPSGVTLGTYVLMRRFEDVVAAANDRLRAMLAGRFTLETSDERESGSRSRRTGLALAVHDHTTDTARDPRSLSGGETFTVSLCLALGLADVVQAEAGGVSLGTLFVDEGFGTLDPETLDDVIGQLSRLTAGGRQVGIVSHVEELKQRIPERIAVRRTPTGGSRVTTTV